MTEFNFLGVKYPTLKPETDTVFSQIIRQYHMYPRNHSNMFNGGLGKSRFQMYK